MSCNFCTAAKCEELSARIGALEQALELLEASFNSHVNQNIPIAHNYIPEVNINHNFQGNQLTIDVGVDTSIDSETITFPESIIPNVVFDIFNLGNNNYVFKVGVNGVFDEDNLSFVTDVDVAFNTSNEIEVTTQLNDVFVTDTEPLPNSDVTIDISELDSLHYGVAVTVGSFQAQDDFYITLPEVEQTQEETHTESSIEVDLSYSNNVLTVYVSDGASNDAASVFIDADVINNFGGGGSSVNCNQFMQELKDCCTTIITRIDTAESLLYAESLEIKNELTIDITGEVNTKYKCEFPLDKDDEIIPTYAESKFETENITDKNLKGLAGIHEYLKLITVNLDSIHSDVCKATPPPIDIPLEQTLTQFCVDNNLQTAEDFEDEESFFDYILAKIQSLLGNSILSALVKKIKFIPGGNAGTFVATTTLQWAIGWLIEKSKAEQTQALTTICETLKEQQDVVSIVASDKVLGRYQGKTLVLHLVTFENYPTRSKNSTYWQVQIPSARETYDWNDDFLNLIWNRGNLYAEMYFDDIKDPVSGFFADKTSADSWFDSILSLTTAIERNRKYHEQQNISRNIAANVTRPYRAFITSINDIGRAVCEVKFVPPRENE